MAPVGSLDWPKLDRSVQETLAWAAASERDSAVGTRGLLIGLMLAGGARSEPDQLLAHVGVPRATLFKALQDVRPQVKIISDASRPSELKAMPSFTTNAGQAIDHARALHGDDRFSPREIFGGVLEAEKSTGYQALSIVLGPEVVDRVRSTYPDYLHGAETQAYSEFLLDRVPVHEEIGSTEPPPTAPQFLVRVDLPNGEFASGVALSVEGLVVTAWSGEAPATGEFRVSFRGDTTPRRAHVRRADFGLAVLELVEPAQPLRADELPRVSAPAPFPETLVVHAVNTEATSSTPVAFVAEKDEGKQVLLSGELPVTAMGAPVVLRDGRLYAIVVVIDTPDGPITAATVPVVDMLVGRPGPVPRPIFVGSLGGAGNDAVGTEDQLGFEHYVRAFAELIDSPYTVPPLTIGIYGPWGMGKTFLLRNIECLLKEDSFRERPHPSDRPRPNVHVVSFNAWEYSANDVIWPGLVRKIMSTLEAETTGVVGRYLLRLHRNLRRQIRVARARIIGGITVLTAALVVALFQTRFDPALLGGVIAALGIGGVVKLFSDAVADPLGQWFTALFEQSSYGTQIGYMEEIKQDLAVLQRGLNQRNGRVLVIIDDLDRCEPDKAVEVLQAVNLLINFDSFIVCLGIDARVITRAVERHYQDLLAEAGASGYEYLDKIVQIPFRIPEPSGPEVDGFLAKQLGDPTPEAEQPPRSVGDQSASSQRGPSPPELTTDGDGDSRKPPIVVPEAARPPIVEDAERPPVAFTFAELDAFTAMTRYMRRNPRHLKRLVNVYRLVRSLAALKGDTSVYRNPRATVRWLVVAAQWPYTASRMLEEFSELLDGWDGKIPSEPPQGDPLVHLLDKIRPRLSQTGLRQLDEDEKLLDELLASEDGRLSWEELDVIRAYTVNFNPAVEEKLYERRSADGEPAREGAGDSR